MANNNFLIAAGGTGMRCLQAFVNLCAIGMYKELGKVHVLLMDTDEENKDKRNAENLIQSYRKIRNSIGGSEYFSCDIELSVFVPDYSKDDRRNFVMLSQLERGASDINHKLANIFYEDAAQEFNLSHGYRAQTHLGSYLMYHAFIEEIKKAISNPVYQNSSELYKFIKDISTANESEARVFAFGSSFGGTGASSIPIIPKAISDCAKIITGGNINPDKIYYSGVVLSNYFKFSSPTDTQKRDEKVIADSQFFSHNSAAALNFYVNDFTISKTYKRLYLLGWPKADVDLEKYKSEVLQAQDTNNVAGTTTGGKLQENPAHLLEVFAASAAHHFFSPTFTGKDELKNIASTQFQYKSLLEFDDRLVIEADDILFKKSDTNDITQIPYHEEVRKNLISFYSLAKLLRAKYDGNINYLADDLKLYNSKYNITDEISETLSYFINYFSAYPKDGGKDLFPGWFSQVFSTLKISVGVEGKEFLGIDSNYFKYSTQDWFVPYLELNGKKSPEDIFITKFKKINGNEVGGEIGEMLEALRKTFNSFTLDSYNSKEDTL